MTRPICRLSVCLGMALIGESWSAAQSVACSETGVCRPRPSSGSMQPELNWRIAEPCRGTKRG
jgi:hypothetical protein